MPPNPLGVYLPDTPFKTLFAAETWVDLPRLVPVCIAYLTVAPTPGTLALRPDIYRRDQAMPAAPSRA